MHQPVVSIVIATYNRATLLRETLRSVLDQRPGTVPFEVIVVDNNSADDTAAVIRSMQAPAGSTLRYVRETQQGNAYARNTGIRHSNGSIIAFTDDDVTVSPDWVQGIVESFRANPTSGFVGGPVLPVWEERPPLWLTAERWGPIGALDYGSSPFEISGSDVRCLLAANLAIRRDVLDRVGAFLPALQRVKDGIGSMEDHELINRLCDAGERGNYVPSVVATTSISAERLSRRYHRRWHRGHGRFYARLRDPHYERSSVIVFGVPMNMYRQAAGSALRWMKAALGRDTMSAYAWESQFWFAVGFIGARARHGVGRYPDNGTRQ
jgi:glycosyltransferase involved in cell wall biosynthesis